MFRNLPKRFYRMTGTPYLYVRDDSYIFAVLRNYMPPETNIYFIGSFSALKLPMKISYLADAVYIHFRREIL